jgi:hypothetical protein
MKGTTPIRIISEGFLKITLPPLKRPSVTPTEEATEALVNWGIQYYVYSLIAHVRTVLRGLIQISDVDNISAAFVLCRHIFEWTAHACYMSQNLQGYGQKKLWQEAWNLLSAAAMGNLWVKRYGEKYKTPGLYGPVSADVPPPIHIRDAVSAYDEYLKKMRREPDAKDSYSFLSEHSHPNSACLMLYHTYAGNVVHFRDANPTPSPLGAVNACLIDLLMFLTDLLGVSAERTVQPDVLAILKAVAKLAAQQKR